MSTTKHTPGPWLFRGKSESVHARCETHPYGEVLFQFNDECAPSDQDLNLILAAPDLLEALESIIDAAAYVAYKGFGGAETENQIMRARSAITKAKGES